MPPTSHPPAITSHHKWVLFLFDDLIYHDPIDRYYYNTNNNNNSIGNKYCHNDRCSLHADYAATALSLSACPIIYIQLWESIIQIIAYPPTHGTDPHRSQLIVNTQKPMRLYRVKLILSGPTTAGVAAAQEKAPKHTNRALILQVSVYCSDGSDLNK